MARPDKYLLQDGTRVPGVTTILGRFKDAGGLIHWAWRQGKDGLDYRESRDAAATAGHMAHEMVEGFIRNGMFSVPKGDDETAVERATTAFDAFLKWAQQTKLKATHTEMPLVSERYRFGGTFDALLVDGRRAMGDWKTSNGIYADYLAQIAAYAILWEEHYPDEPIDGGFHLLRFDKTYGDFHHHYWSELEAGKRYFLNVRAAYEDDKELKARAK
ncbi:MAG: hypothetical protein QNJ62_04980 [Methyloceanibacter sp.]|nr:hypothetical protein [Methyloceanibacter sp.]